MKSDQNFELIGEIEISSFKNMLFMLQDSVWEEFDFRQKNFNMHRKTRTIPLIFDTDFRTSNPTYWKYSKFVEKDLEGIFDILKEKYGDGHINRAILVKLPANKDISRHIDKGPILTPCKRCHIPILTHEKVYFEIDDEVKNLKEGQVWEINNSEKYHSVTNAGDGDRIHLIVDWMPPPETH